MNKKYIQFIKHAFNELCRPWKIISLLGIVFLLSFSVFWFHSEIATPLIVSILTLSYLSTPFVNATLLSLVKDKHYFFIKMILINICALFIFQFSYMIDYHFSSMYAYRPGLLQCFLLYFGGIALWRQEMSFKDFIFSIKLGKIYQIKRWIFIILTGAIISFVALFLIYAPITYIGLSGVHQRPYSLLLQQLYLYKLKIHFTYNDFESVYYITWASENQKTLNEAMELAQHHYMPIQLVRFAIFAPGVQSNSLLRQIDYTPLNLHIIQDNACDLDDTSDPTVVARLIEHEFTCQPDEGKLFMRLPYLLDIYGKEIKNP